MGYEQESCFRGEPTLRSPDQPPAFAQTAAGEARRELTAQAPANGTSAVVRETVAASIEEPVPPERSPLRVGSAVKHYEIIRQLGQGGMGTVFLARDTKLGRLVAIKVLLQHGGQAAERFLVEARATARCKHENIVVIHEVDELCGYPYMVLEYLEGRTLRDWTAQRERPGAPEPPAAADTPSALMSPSLAIELIIPVVRALCCAHQHGIVHRDLKPTNIFLTDAGPVKVLDFGIAKQFRGATLAGGTELTQKRAPLGTLPYMAPEQLLSMEVDPRCDLWAVGIILYELCTGAHPLAPFAPSSLTQVLTLDEPMPSVSDKRRDVGPLGAVIDRCLKKRRAERVGSAEELCAALEQLSPGRKAQAIGEDESPFAGLSPFQEADAARFFGREREVQSVMGRLRNQPLVAVAGPSGAGKSSFVRAGVIPALKRSGERWEAFILRPGRWPLAALADVLAQATDAMVEGGRPGAPDASSPEGLIEGFRTQPGLLGARLRARCRRQGSRHRALLFVDQFEELYTLSADPGERAAFVACLAGVADDASSPLRVILSVRSDFLDRMAEDRRLMTEVTRGLVFLPPMGRDSLREALTQPVEATGHRFESEGMVAAMLDALERTRSPLPLLQFTAAKLWEARDRERRLLTQDSYDKLGGVAGALSTHADAIIAGLSWVEQRLCRAVLLRLVTPERTRAVVNLAELRGLAGDNGAVEEVVQRLADARLLLIETDSEHEGATVELIHESLVERWAKLKQWLDESERDAQFLARLRAAAQQWEASGEAEGLLWRDRAAADARAWLEQRRAEQGASAPLGLGKREERYLLAVVALSERARRRRRQLATGLIATLFMIALVVSCLANRASREAAHARDEATRADQEAARAQSEALQARNATRMAAARELRDDPTTGLALLREVEQPGVPRGWADLALAALHSGLTLVALPHPDGVRWAEFSPDSERIVTACDDKAARVWNADGTGAPLVLRGHEGAVTSASFSPDGKRIVTTSWDKTARVWNADGTGAPLVLRGHEALVYSAAWSPDGKRIVTASGDKTARVWSADGTGAPLVLRGHEDEVESAAFSPDGKRIVTASWDKTARVWNADGTGAPLILRGHEGEVYWASWSPDGKRIVTASRDKTARVWNADGTGAPVVLRGHEGVLESAVFSPDGERIVTASWDRTARVWNADGTGAPVILRGHESLVLTAVWSSDGKRIVTASLDRTARVWSADGTGAPVFLRGHEGEIHTVAWSPGGERIVTASGDRTAQVWNTDGTGAPLVLRGHEGTVQGAAFSPDGKRVVTASLDRTARVWNADGTGAPVVLRGHEGEVTSASFSPDGKRIVTASADRTARVWNADGTGAPVILRGHEDVVQSAAFSPDGKRIVTASLDKTARVWNADGTGAPLVLRGHEGVVTSASWSPDGERIVTASWDKTARVWSADGTGAPLVLRGHESVVLSASWSPDGERIVTASGDRTARVWSADGTGAPMVLRGHEGAVTSASFSPDGKRIATASDDKTARVWNDLTPLRDPDDPKLWTATPYCMSVERRIALLNVSEATARAEQQACERRVGDAQRQAVR